MEFLAFIFLIGRWSVGWWSVDLVSGWFVGGRRKVIGWSVGRWSVVRSRLVGDFKKTPRIVILYKTKLMCICMQNLNKNNCRGAYFSKVTCLELLKPELF